MRERFALAACVLRSLFRLAVCGVLHAVRGMHLINSSGLVDIGSFWFGL